MALNTCLTFGPLSLTVGPVRLSPCRNLAEAPYNRAGFQVNPDFTSQLDQSLLASVTLSFFVHKMGTNAIV